MDELMDHSENCESCTPSAPHVLRPTSRREVLSLCSGGFGMLALSGMMGLQKQAEAAAALKRQPGPLAAKQPHHAPRAKRVIFLFMHGGPSQMDTFDPKPRLDAENGGVLPIKHPVGITDPDGKILKSPWEFSKYGESGADVSSLFPEQAKIVDDLCIIRSMHTEGQSHGQAVLKLHTGQDALVRPSWGSWVLYGLGAENDNLPGYITICPTLDHGGVSNWGSAFLPAIYQGTPIGNAGIPASKAQISYINNPKVPAHLQRKQLDLLQSMNRDYQKQGADDSRLEGVIESYELAFRMQMHAPKLLDISGESKETLKLYGVDEKPTDNFARQCLLARRCAEAGVRFIQVSHSFKWDQHSNLKGGHESNAKETDKPVAALIRDLKARGLLEDTLVIWGGEFGRTPTVQGKDGRDHNPRGFTIWMAGGGVKPGLIYGATDEYGYYAVENKVHMHDLHATILHILGLDHERVTYRYAGRDFRLTDVYGTVVKDIFA
jgi:hypothetical protein